MYTRHAGEHDQQMPTPTCILKLIRDVPSAVLDLILGPEEKIAYVTVTTR